MKIKGIEKIAATFHPTARAVGQGMEGWTFISGAAPADADLGNPAAKRELVPIGSDPESVRRSSGNKKMNVGGFPMAGSGALALNGVSARGIWAFKPRRIR